MLTVEKLENAGENTFERTDLLQYSRSLPQCWIPRRLGWVGDYKISGNY